MAVDKTVLIALRTHQFDGKPASKAYRDILYTDVMLVVASLTEAEISHADRIGVVPFGEGRCAIRYISAHQKAKLIEHYFSGHTYETQTAHQNGRIELDLQQTRNHEILEWLEIVFA